MQGLPHAPCRLQRIIGRRMYCFHNLCLHTLRADCNLAASPTLMVQTCSLPPHAPCRLQRGLLLCLLQFHLFASTRSVQIATITASRTKRRCCFASTRPVQIATFAANSSASTVDLCLHTPRTDCNHCGPQKSRPQRTLPPHAPYRLQPPFVCFKFSTNSLPPHAPYRLQRRRRFFWIPSTALPPHAPYRLQLLG